LPVFTAEMSKYLGISFGRWCRHIFSLAIYFVSRADSFVLLLPINLFCRWVVLSHCADFLSPNISISASCSFSFASQAAILCLDSSLTCYRGSFFVLQQMNPLKQWHAQGVLDQQASSLLNQFFFCWHSKPLVMVQSLQPTLHLMLAPVATPTQQHYLLGQAGICICARCV